MGHISLAELKEYRRTFRLLGKRIEKTERRLLHLPEKLGFKTLEDLIEALRNVQPQQPASKSKAKSNSRQKRTSLTPEIKAAVGKLVTAGETSAFAAKQMKISIASVNNIKKEFGLVRERSKKS